MFLEGCWVEGVRSKFHHAKIKRQSVRHKNLSHKKCWRAHQICVTFSKQVWLQVHLHNKFSMHSSLQIRFQQRVQEERKLDGRCIHCSFICCWGVWQNAKNWKTFWRMPHPEIATQQGSWEHQEKPNAKEFWREESNMRESLKCARHKWLQQFVAGHIAKSIKKINPQIWSMANWWITLQKAFQISNQICGTHVNCLLHGMWAKGGWDHSLWQSD